MNRHILAKNILLQRVELQRFTWLRLVGRLRQLRPSAASANRQWHPSYPSIYQWLVSLDAALWPGSIIQRYRAKMGQDWAQLAPHLPHEAAMVMDLGCGIAGIDEFVWDKYQATLRRLCLVDQEGESRHIHYGFSDSPSHYNHLGLSKDYLMELGVPSDIVECVNIDDTALPDSDFDVILSLVAWGFHFPIATYLEWVKEHLAPEGIVITDCRKGTDGLEQLKKAFDVQIIVSSAGLDRVACRHAGQSSPWVRGRASG